MQIVTLYATTAAIFLVLDAIMLNTVIAPLFRQHLGDAILDTPRLGAASVFYLFYVAGLLLLVSWPAYQGNDLLRALWQGALVGALAYGTYEMTNYATLADWHPKMVVTDWIWGTFLTAASATGGIWATRAILG
ncbi:MAG: DUF2177 family protein [Silicimonas sp.]|jgi:uncharacterized membrane protein|nr:DUF2177 family protein [Silicimonas sp.]